MQNKFQNVTLSFLLFSLSLSLSLSLPVHHSRVGSHCDEWGKEAET